MAASEQRIHPAGAGGVLLGTIAVCAVLGALIGWAAGSWQLGALGGAVVGIPAGTVAVYRRYRSYFT